MDHSKEQILKRCPECDSLVKEPIKENTRYAEYIPSIEKPEVTKHILQGYWYSTCKEVASPTLTDALPNSIIALRLLVFTAWLHSLVGVSFNNIVKIFRVVCHFKISTGGLTWA